MSSLIPEALKGHIGQACKTYSDVSPYAKPIAADMAVAVLDSKLNAHGNSFIIRTVEPMEKQMGMSPLDIGRQGGRTFERGGVC
jgi:hypothetical protein